MKIKEAFDWEGYTFILEGMYLTRQSAKAQFSWMKRNDELCEDSRYQIKYITGIPDPSYALYIWH